MERRKRRHRELLRRLRVDLVVSLILILIGLASYQTIRTVLLRNAQDLGDSLAANYAGEVDNDLQVYETLLVFAGDALESQVVSGAGTGEISAWLQRYYARLQSILGAGAVDPYALVDGQIAAANPWEGDETYDYARAEWYGRAMAAPGEVVFTDVYLDAIYQRAVVTLALACDDETVIAFDIFPENFHFQTTMAELPESASFFLCDGLGTLIYAQSDLGRPEKEVQAYVCGLRDQIRSGALDAYDASVTDLDGEQRGIYYYELPNGWLSIVTVPFTSILRDLRAFTAGFLGVFLLVFLLFAVFTWREVKVNAKMERTNETVRVLGNSYYALYRVDFGQGTYEMIKGSDYIRRRMPPAGRYEDLLRVMQEVIDDDSRGEYVESFSIPNIHRLVAHKIRDFGGDFRRRFGAEYRWVSVRVLFDESLAPEEVVLCFREVDQEKQHQLQERKLLEDSLRAARQSEASKQAFFSNMSHDMRTPLNAIINLSGLAEASAEDPEKTRAYLRKIDVSSRQLLQLINDILDMSRMEQGRMLFNDQELDLAECMEECVSPFRAQAEKEGKEFQLQCDLQCRWVMADRLRISQIMNNLLSNAFKFTAPGDLISVAVVQLDQQEYAKYRIVVSDTGIGMSQEFLPHLFEPYARETRFSAKPTLGTGLGMPIVKNLVEQMEGHVYVESEQGKGTTFTIVLPLLTAPRGQEEGGARSHGQGAPSFHLSGKRVLLAEDNEINMEVATELLSAAGLELTQAWNGREALDAFRASEPFWFDVVLMDMQMPEMDGCEAARRIRRLRRPDARTVPIIAVTANTFAEDIAATEEAGMDAHISKPIDFSDLCRTMERLIRERRQTQGGETG